MGRIERSSCSRGTEKQGYSNGGGQRRQGSSQGGREGRVVTMGAEGGEAAMLAERAHAQFIDYNRGMDRQTDTSQVFWYCHSKMMKMKAE